ncbi:L,D-transpeptidase [Methylosinus sp. Sm6]|uniref:L,D-transpeptidase n=1 Tax=Methylosinus sp. Sm6 TaxID=2866948 RepID=UPI001C9958FA|nr:L,D-transpeptidase [Methylosinus sp. Sm6]MBY6244088.1 L,D-transpeptidase [Methylosinus sp. Sm6]
MSFRRRLVLGLALALTAPPALGQYYTWPDDRRGAYDPWDDDREDARPQRRAPREYDRDRRPALSGAARENGARVAALPPDADPNYSTPVDYDDLIDLRQSRRRLVDDRTGETPGTLTIDTRARRLLLSLEDGRAMEYAIGVGRTGFAWKGEAQIGRKAFWPGWTPPPEMLERRPDLPPHMDGGLENPLGARALYLFQGNKDTLFRIHGTNEPESIGHAVSSGCIRMLNADVIDLYQRVAKGARVVVR